MQNCIKMQLNERKYLTIERAFYEFQIRYKQKNCRVDSACFSMDQKNNDIFYPIQITFVFGYSSFFWITCHIYYNIVLFGQRRQKPSHAQTAYIYIYTKITILNDTFSEFPIVEQYIQYWITTNIVFLRDHFEFLSLYIYNLPPKQNLSVFVHAQIFVHTQ